MNTSEINISLKMKVIGAQILELRNEKNEINGEKHTRLQALVIDSETGVETLKTVKVTKAINIEKVINKTIECINTKEFKIEYSTYFTCENIKLIDETLKSDFEVNKSITLKITNISKITNQDNNTTYAIYSHFMNEYKLETFKIKVKEVNNDKLFESLKNKTVLISNLNVIKMPFNTYYSIDNLDVLKIADK